MIDNAIRRMLPRFVSPMIAIYQRLGLTPNHVTAMGFGFALAASAAVASGANTVALGLWWLGRLLDGTDGIYARETGAESPYGAYLDILLDMAAYGVMVLGFAIAVPSLWALWVTILFFYTLCVTSALALGAQEAHIGEEPRDNRGLRLGAGLAEGGETGIAYSVFLIWPAQLIWTAGIWAVVLAITVVARTILARRSLAVPDSDP